MKPTLSNGCRFLLKSHFYKKNLLYFPSQNGFEEIFCFFLIFFINLQKMKKKMDIKKGEVGRNFKR